MMNHYFGRGRTTVSTASTALAAALSASCVVGLTGLVGLVGCSDVGDMYTKVLPQRADLVAEGKVKVQVVSGPGIEVSPPTVFRENSELVISGTVTRQPGSNDSVPGFLELRVLGREGQLLDESLLHWSPTEIPTDGTRSARYTARVLGIPPNGSTVQVTYTQSVTHSDAYARPGRR